MGTVGHSHDNELGLSPLSPSSEPLPPILNRWYRSARCISGSCLEIQQFAADRFGLQDSKQAHLGDAQPVISFNRDAYIAFLDEFIGAADPGTNAEVDVVTMSDGDTIVRARSTGVELRFDSEEVKAFIAGIHRGEFRPALASA